MKRSNRIILNGLTLLSLLVFVAISLLWIFLLLAPQISVYDITLVIGRHEFHFNSSSPIWIAAILFAILPVFFGYRWIWNRIALRRQEPGQLPGEIDFKWHWSMDLDERHAAEMFLGKTAEQAEAMFRQSFLFYQEDLSSMRGPAFRFYVVPAIHYLCSSSSDGDSDAASSFSFLLERRLLHDPESISPIRTIAIDAICSILSNFSRYDCDPEIYGDVRGRYQTLLALLHSKMPEKT